MIRYTFGTPEEHVPSRYCPRFDYRGTPSDFPKERFTFRETDAGSNFPSRTTAAFSASVSSSSSSITAAGP